MAPRAPKRCPVHPVSIRDIDATEMYPGLWQGGLQEYEGCAVSFGDLDGTVVLAPDAGVTVVAPPTAVLPLDDSGIRSRDMAKIRQVRTLSHRVGRAVENGSRMAIFCRQGRNRSGLLTALVLRRLNGWTGTEAMEYIKTRRPTSLQNEHFERFLAGLARPRRR